MRITFSSFLWPVLLLAAMAAAGLPLPSEDAEQLARRFRPYDKFSVEGNAQEPCHPCSWQWFAAHSDLLSGDKQIFSAEQMGKNPGLLLSAPEGNILTATNRTGPLKLIPRSGTEGGEPWAAVHDTGAGLYVQVEDAGGNLIVLTYWNLFAFNRTTAIAAWGGGNHSGDITGVVLVYDRVRDQLVRASFGLHGRILESFDLAGGTIVRHEELTGRRTDGGDESVSSQVMRIAPEAKYEDGPYYFKPAEPADLYWAQDPQSRRFDHLVVFYEWGSHEPWPSPGGSLPLTPDHNGQGISFLPATVRFLGSFSHPPAAEAPLVYFNGYWGSVPKGLIFHRACFYPEGRSRNHFRIPPGGFVDRDPFSKTTLPWPPRTAPGHAQLNR